MSCGKGPRSVEKSIDDAERWAACRGSLLDLYDCHAGYSCSCRVKGRGIYMARRIDIDDDGEEEGERRNNELRRAPGMTPAERSSVLGTISGFKAIAPGENATTVPVDPSAIADHGRTELGFVAESEPMTTYLFEDGSSLRAKSILMRVQRVDGAYLPDGTPMYEMVWNQSMYIVAGPGVRRGEGGA